MKFFNVKNIWKNRPSLGGAQNSQTLAAFLPAALEIQETPPNPLARWLAWSLLALIIIGILWACYGHVDIVSSAEGKIIPSSRVKQIQPLEKGLVKSILVREGQRVTQGQALVELDATLTQADKTRLTSEYHKTQLNLFLNRALLSRLEAPESQEAVTLPTATTMQEKNLYQKLLIEKVKAHESELKALQKSIEKTKAEQAASLAIQSKLSQTMPIAIKQTQTLKALFEQNLVSENQYLNAEQNRIKTQQDLVAEKQRLAQLQAAQSEAEAHVQTYHAQGRGQLLADISEQQRQLAALEEELVKATDRNAKQVLYAPVSGRVQSLAVNTIGGVVTDAQQLMVIVPEQEQLEVEVFLENKDIGFVYEGMNAEVKIHTFPFTQYGIIDASIKHVSSDAIVDEQRGLIYSMLVTLEKNTIAVKGKEIRLKPGMAVTAEVKTGQRRIIEFFLAPLLRAKQESIRER